MFAFPDDIALLTLKERQRKEKSNSPENAPVSLNYIIPPETVPMSD